MKRDDNANNDDRRVALQTGDIHGTEADRDAGRGRHPRVRSAGALGVAVFLLLSAAGLVEAVEIPFSARQSIDAEFTRVDSAVAADINGDGDLDVVGASSDGLSWWQNTSGDGSTWAEEIIDSNSTGVNLIRAVDIDGDGDLDVLGSTNLVAGRIDWWENTEGDGSAWEMQTIVAFNFSNASSVQAADIDGDGDLDVVGASQSDDEIAWWENTAGDGSLWTKNSVDSMFDGARSVDVADIDGDGDLDIAGAAITADDFAWWENTGGDGTAWIEHSIDDNVNTASFVHLADMDGDGDADVLGAASTAGDIVWWENTAGDGTAWNERSIDNNFGASFVQLEDLDGDGDLDVLGAASFGNAIAWWENTAGDATAWTERTIDGGFDRPFSVFAADLDGDGDLDVLGAASTTGDIDWWENETIHRSATFPED
ncbi:MAG: VCBS repeat-containing protein, partial [Acidobacteriota bacterium]